jgi:hypothetical protein
MESHQFPYTSSEWMVHFRAAAESSHDQRESAQEWADSYFEKQFSDPAEARYKADRLMAALSYWEANVQEFNSGKVSVVGQEKALLSGAMGYALYAYFGQMPEHQVGRAFPPVKDVRDMAQSIALKYG